MSLELSNQRWEFYSTADIISNIMKEKAKGKISMGNLELNNIFANIYLTKYEKVVIRLSGEQ